MHDGEHWSGTVTFIGFNRMLNNAPHITINKTPLYPIDFNDVYLEDEMSSAELRAKSS